MSAPSGGVHGCPENRVTARSALPQKKWTRETLPLNAARCSSNTGSISASTRQKRCAASGSYATCVVSSGNGIGSGTSWGMVESSVSTPTRRSAPMKSDQNAAIGRAASATVVVTPATVRITTWWSMKSASTSSSPAGDGTGPVVMPRGDT